MLVSGSRPWVIHEKSVDKVRAKLISCGVNIPITEEAEERLFQKKITIVPAFISNSGGALSSQLGALNVTVDQAFKGIRTIIGENVLEVLKAASEEKVSPTRLATQKAIETIRRWRAERAPT
jgi:glutamate dehydrogenase/leucine dehydrogenase